MRRSILCALLVAGACHSVPAHVYTVPGGVVRAHDPDEARETALLFDALAPRVAAILDVSPDLPFDVRYNERNRKGGSVMGRLDKAGDVQERWIEIGPKGRSALPFVVAHELVHWYWGEPWVRLPYVVEEGLADFIAMELAPDYARSRRAELGAHIDDMSRETLSRHLGTPRHEARASPAEDLTIYAVGFVVTEHLGLAGLRALAERAAEEGLAEAPLAWFLAAVQFPPTIAQIPSGACSRGLACARIDELREGGFEERFVVQFFDADDGSTRLVAVEGLQGGGEIFAGAATATIRYSRCSGCREEEIDERPERAGAP